VQEMHEYLELLISGTRASIANLFSSDWVAWGNSLLYMKSRNYWKQNFVWLCCISFSQNVQLGGCDGHPA
jgi:sensor domain CHASE-containing protein